MFNLIKKDKDKEKDARKEKKKKKEKKERMSAAELKSLEEMSVRRGLFHRAAKKDVKSKLEISSPRPAHTDQVDLGVWPTSTRDDAKVEVISRDERRSSVRERAAKLARQSSQVGQMMKRLSFSQKNKDESPLGASTSPPGELHNKHSPASLESNLQQPPARFGDGMSSVRIPQLVDRTFPADLRSPPVEPPSPPEMRELEVRRRDTGDFGFSLRRSSTLDRRAPEGSTCRHMVHFAEPGAGVRDVTLGLVPGDRLVEINGVNVEKRNRDEIVEMIRQSGEAVWLKVQPIPELKELSRCWLRSLAGLGREAREARTEEQIAVEQTWHIKGQVWLVHREGFSLATLEGREGDGKVKIRLEHNGTELVVDEDDVEKANPPSVCHVQDAASLHYLNESSVVQVVCRRSAAGLLHTYAGPHMLLLSRTCTPALYSEKIMLMFKGCRRDNVAPHVYSMAQAAYRSLLTTRHDQALVLLGRSGAGKSLTAQHLLHYLSTVAGSSGKAFYVEKWQAVQTVLVAFGNSATCNNNNSTRFTLITSLHFDQSGQVASSSVQTLLLEKTRVTRQPDGESTFHVFYYLLAGADDSLRNELHLNHFAESNAFGIVPHSKSEDKQRSSQQFMKLQAAMKLLGVCAEEQKALWLILGAIYHLGAAGATTGGRLQFVRHEWAQKAAYLLGCSLEDLASHTFKQQHKSATHRAKSTWLNLDTQNSTEANGSSLKALECLEVLAWGLYSEVFSLLISLVNRSLKSSQSCVCSLLIVDSPGLQNPQRAATFQELCHNYTQERLNTLFYERSVTNELERYREENIELALEDIESGVSPSIAVVDQLSRQSQVRTLPPTHTQPRGLIWLMEEEALQPNGSEEALLEQLFSNYTPAQEQDRGPVVLLRGEQPLRFLLGHSHGTHWVEYDAHDWLLHARHTGRIAAALLHNSQKKSLSSLFVGRAGGTARLEGGSQLRKSYHTSVARVKKSLCIHVKLTVDALIDTLRKSRLHFLHCLIPRACVGGSPMEAGPMELDPALLRAQIRGFRLLDALRVYRHGYPDHLVFSEFRRRFEVLVTQLSKKRGRSSIVTDEQRAAQELLEVLELEKSSYHMGLSKVFFRAGALARLEEQRDEQIGRNMVLLQAECRGHLSRVAFRRRKVQDLAIRCIQKNIQKNRGVKDWPWWKLLTAVRPLIQVQLTEEQIRGKDEEIRQLKGKLDKLEKERTELRLNNDRLDSRITELSTELAEERSAAESASQMLEVELSERLRQEKELQELQNQQEAGQKQMEAMQMEVMEARLLQVSEVNVEMDAEENGTSGGEWRLRYERLMREADFKSKKLQQELDDKLEDEQQSRRQLERKLTDLQADHEESQHAVQQLKKKSHRQAAELQDIRLHMETQQRRNHELEKKQRKFDLEQAQVQDELQREKNMKEKACREKELLSSEMLSLRQQLQERQGEASSARLRVEQLEVELQDLSSQETRDEVSLARLRKHLRELENKAKEQEEELDEQAGAIQMLEQAKLRLEMEMERLRQSHTKELEGHEEEVEQIRQSCSKKLKQIEIQLEEEHHEKQKVLRERKELETRLRSVQEQVSQCDVDGERRLKKDLKRTKVLLADAQIMLEHLKTNTSSKREISQIKSQLEESESSYAAALKSRKAMELELEELHAQMDDVSKTKAALEEQLSRLQREKNDLQVRVEEDQEDMNDLMKKHKVVITQSAWNLAQISDLQVQLDEAIKEKQEVQDKFQALQSQLEFVEQSTVEKCVVSRQETKICELETKLEYERSQTRRLESAAARLKENMEKLVEERDQHVAGEIREREQTKRLQRQIRELKEEIGEHVKREAEATQRKHQLELDMEGLEASNHSLQADLKLAFKRIGDLQSALEDDVESDDKDDLLHSADSDTDTQVDSMKSWLSQNKISRVATYRLHQQPSQEEEEE